MDFPKFESWARLGVTHLYSGRGRRGSAEDVEQTLAGTPVAGARATGTAVAAVAGRTSADGHRLLGDLPGRHDR